MRCALKYTQTVYEQFYETKEHEYDTLNTYGSLWLESSQVRFYCWFKHSLFFFYRPCSFRVPLQSGVRNVVHCSVATETLNKWFITLFLLHLRYSMTLVQVISFCLFVYYTLWFLLSFFLSSLFCLMRIVISSTVNRITVQIGPIVLKESKQKNKNV